MDIHITDWIQAIASVLTMGAAIAALIIASTQGYIHIEEGLRVAADRVSACIADLLDSKRATIRDAGVAIAA